jgi:TP901 family phage tail tape measure protein
MGLSRAELLLVIRARDEASRAIHGLARSMRGDLTKAQMDSINRSTEMGRAWSSAGLAIAGAGLAGLAGLNSLAKGAQEYENAAAKTLTQTDNIGASLEDIKNLGFEIGQTLPVALEQVQPALYDIFSSMDVNMKQARKLIKQIAKDSVGGFTSMEVAGDALIGIMNAYKVEVKDASKVSDFMFQLVRKGRGTYEEFTASIGKAIPSALRAGQSYQELGGMLAFMTRNGMSAAMAGTSAARALDAMSHPKTIGRLEDMGVKVKDASGEYRDMSLIVQDLGKKLSTMSAPERAKALQELFKGSGGTIQARRFFDLVFKNMDEYQQRVKEMKNANKAAADAFKIGVNTDEAKIRRAGAAFDVLKTKIGDAAKSIKADLAPAFTDLFNTFNKLDPNTQKILVGIVGALSALIVIGGTIATAIGGYLLLDATLIALGTTMGALAATVGWVVLAIAAVAAVGVLVYKNWNTIGPLFDTVWNKIKAGIMSLEPFWNKIKAAAMEIWNYAKANLIPAFQELWTTVQPYLAQLWANTKKWGDAFMVHVWPWITKVAGFMAGAFVIKVVTSIKIIIAIIAGMVRVLAGSIKVIHGIMTGDWKEAWDGATQVAKAAKDTTVKIGKELADAAKKANKEAQATLPKDTKTAMDATNKELKNGGARNTRQATKNGADVAKAVKTGATKSATEATKAGATAAKALGTGSAKPAEAAGKAMGQGFIKGMNKMQPQIDAAAKRMARSAVNAAKKEAGIASPSKVMYQLGKWMGQGFLKGMTDQVKFLAYSAGAGAKAIALAFNKSLAKYVSVQEQLKKVREDLASNIESMRQTMRDFASGQNVLSEMGDFKTVDGFIRGLEQRRDTLLDFAQSMTTLKSRGLDANALAQLGTPENAEFLSQLAGASQEEIDRINQLYKSVNAIALVQGKKIGQDTFLVGQQAGMGFIKGLESQQSQLLAATKKLAQQLIAALKKHLKIASPSKIFLNIGSNLGNSLAQGMLDTQSSVARASAMLASQASLNPAVAPVGAYARGTGGDTYITEQNIDVHTQEIDPRKNAADLGYRLVHVMGVGGES